MLTSVFDIATVAMSLVVVYLCYRCAKKSHTGQETGPMVPRDHSQPVTCTFRLPPRDIHGQLARQGTMFLGLQAIGRHMGIELAYDAHEFEEKGLMCFSVRLTGHDQFSSGGNPAMSDAGAPTFHNDELAFE
jgi:hypothetical protein